MSKRQKRRSSYSIKSNIDMKKQNNKKLIKRFLELKFDNLFVYFACMEKRRGVKMEINEILNDKRKIATLRVIEQPANVSSALEISIEAELPIDETEKVLRTLENANLVRQEAGYYGITLEGMRTMKNVKKYKLI